MSRKKDRWYQQTEGLLYAYKSFPIRIMALTQATDESINWPVADQIGSEQRGLVASYERREGKVYTVSSPVEADGNVYLESVLRIRRKIENLKKLMEIVDVSITTMLNEEQVDLVERIYFNRYTWQRICMDLCIDKSTYYEKKGEVVKMLAWCFGYLPDEEAEKMMGLFINPALWRHSAVKTGNNYGINS